MLENAAHNVSELYRVVDLVGVFCNGVIGARIAREKKFDYVGFAILGLMSALGGGAVRDVLLNTVPIALTDPYYLGVALSGALVAYIWKLDSRWTSKLINLGDALVLGCWSATGVIKTLSMGFGVIPALLMGITTAVGGSMIRDVACGNIPKVLQRETVYVTPALLAGGLMIVFYYLHRPIVGMGVAILAAVIVVVIAQWRQWRLPEAPEWTVTLTSTQLRQLMTLRGIKIQRRGSRDDKVGEDDDDQVT